MTVSTMENKKKKAGRLLAVLFALLVWQIAAMTVNSKILLVSPVEVFLRLLTIWREPDFVLSVWTSFRHIAGGFLLAVAVGTLLAVIAGRFPLAETLLYPFLATVKAVPVASFVVICLIWLSAERLSVFISFLIVLPVIYGNLLSGLKAEDEKMLEAGRVFALSPMRRLGYIHLPQLKPHIMSALETALGMAWKAGVAAEIIGTPEGSIGRQLYLAKLYLDTDDLLCWTVVIVAVSVLFEKLVMLLVKSAYRRMERG